MYNWNDIKYATVINNNNYTLFEQKNLEIALVELYAAVDVKVFLEEGTLNAHIHKLTKQSYVSKQYYERGKKSSFVINS